MRKCECKRSRCANMCSETACNELMCTHMCVENVSKVFQKCVAKKEVRKKCPQHFCVISNMGAQRQVHAKIALLRSMLFGVRSLMLSLRFCRGTPPDCTACVTCVCRISRHRAQHAPCQVKTRINKTNDTPTCQPRCRTQSHNDEWRKTSI